MNQIKEGRNLKFHIFKYDPQKEGDKPKAPKKAAKKADEEEGDVAFAFADLAADKKEVRRIALSAMEAGDDSLTFKLERIENRVEGRMVVDTGILRFVGKMLAKFSADTLE